MRFFIALLTILWLGTLTSQAQETFASAWPSHMERIWPGEDYYANRFVDWRIKEGRLECIGRWRNKPMRTVHLLSHCLGATGDSFTMSVTTGSMAKGARGGSGTWSGFLIGTGGAHVDFRVSALCHHWPGEDGGLICAIDGKGNAVFRLNNIRGGRNPKRVQCWPELNTTTREGPGFGAAGFRPTKLKLTLLGATLSLTATDARNGRLISRATVEDTRAELLDGNIALVSHRLVQGNAPGYWFRDWRASGGRLEYHPERRFGPILSAMHTLSDDTLKMAVQLPPLGLDDAPVLRLLTRATGTQGFKQVAQSKWNDHSFTANFKLTAWDSTVSHDYRVEYDLITAPGKTETHTYTGTVRAEPTDAVEFVVAAFTGHHISARGMGNWNEGSIWYPHSDLVNAVKKHQPDFLFFSGDQIYESGLAGVIRGPEEDSIIDYHYHWLRWCWAFRDLARDLPCVCLPDDHDVYHGNIWGAGGKKAVRLRGVGQNSQDSGGYTMSPLFVNTVHATQVSHLPDPLDPAPILQGISTYHTVMDYGGLSFAIIADRMFKSSPSVMVPEGDCKNGWFRAPGFDAAKSADTPGCRLLGDRQLSLLQNWTEQWDRDTWMKVLLSQTIFSNIATIPATANNDGVVPGLKYPGPGEYVEGDQLAADADSNGWPRTPRNRALRIIRRCFPFHIAGDQHLASFSRYGVDEWGDGPYALCVPSIANLWPRRWFPPHAGLNRAAGAPFNTGDFHDGFGNKMTVLAVANPMKSGVEPTLLHDRMPGYGIVRFNRETRTIKSEVWPRWVDPDSAVATQYPGWPITVRQEDNYGRQATGYLPTISVSGMTDPIVQVLNETEGNRVEYTVRIKGTSYRPKIFDNKATYTVIVSDSSERRIKSQRFSRTNLKVARKSDATITFAFPQ